MADIFRRKLDEKTGIGGVHCYCCNDYHGKKKPNLNRKVRHLIKQVDKKEIVTEINEIDGGTV